MAIQRRVLILGSVLLLLVLGLLGTAYALRPQPAISANFVGRETLASQSIEGYARAFEARPFEFPADHGPHPDYQLEWWYYTGNLATADGRRFGYQFTVFRRSLTPTAAQRASQWGTNQIYLAHFAVTDVQNNRFYATSDLARGGDLGIAGATADPYRVFVKTWSAEGTGDTVRIRAAQANVAIDLNLQSLKPATLQGESSDGLSRKGDEPGNASYYYSLTRMATDGTLTIDGQALPVRGFSWMDHEWSTNLLEQGQNGWDWFGLQLDDNREIMWGQLRRDDGTIDFGFGSITNADGSVTAIDGDDAQVSVLKTWRSPHTDAEYPAQWRLQVLSEQIDITVTPLVADQELNVGLTYWEGAVEITGSATGHGYVELTGYGLDAPPVR